MIAKRFLARPGAAFLAVFLWKIALLAFLALPVPSNDAFFYDGPVVNFLAHGQYANPALAPALPISGTEVFCAYPPLYQTVLWGWMSLFGASALSAMTLHLALFGLYMWILLAVLRRLAAPAWVVRVAALFLFVITFHDRPDSLAHVFGLAALYAWVRCRPSLAPPPTGPLPTSPATPPSTLDTRPSTRPAGAGWAWAMAGFAVLSLATGLQIGALYSLLLWIGMLATSLLARDRFPYVPMLAMALVPAALVALVGFGFPRLWAGFMEHARQTPSLTGWRMPRLDEALKIVRNAPGLLAAAALVLWLLAARRLAVRAGEPSTLEEGRRFFLVALTATLAALFTIVASLFVLTPNSVLFVGPIQPLAVGACLALLATRSPSPGRLRVYLWLFLALAALGSIRAIGLTTWGAACTAKDGYPAALRCVRAELQGCAPGSTVVLSSAYLYEAARHGELRWIHSDWMAPAGRDPAVSDWEGLTALKPARLILTQFDYYRRYEPLLARLKARPDLATVAVVNTARIPAPDSIRALQKVIQHVSWAPVVVTIMWK